MSDPTPDDRDGFYVGWRADMPAALVRPVRRAVLALLLLAVVLAVTRALVSEPFAPAVFEFGSPSRFEGTLREHPVPRLELDRPGPDAVGFAPGAAPLFKNHDGAAPPHGGESGWVQRDGPRKWGKRGARPDARALSAGKGDDDEPAAGAARAARPGSRKTSSPQRRGWHER